jgi:O-acetyl-ADP-ribose deacetylase (regulator of RNase III)
MIQYKIGDATRPHQDSRGQYQIGEALGTPLPSRERPRIIIHCCNDQGAWGKGFVLALSQHWPLAEEAYRQWHTAQHNPVDHLWPGRVETSGPFKLGEVQFVLVGPRLWVGSIIGQHGIRIVNGKPPIRYEAIQDGLKKVYRWTQIHEGSVHMPRMGSGLSGGRWDAVEKLVKVELAVKGVDVTVYDLA